MQLKFSVQRPSATEILNIDKNLRFLTISMAAMVFSMFKTSFALSTIMSINYKRMKITLLQVFELIMLMYLQNCFVVHTTTNNYNFGGKWKQLWYTQVS